MSLMRHEEIIREYDPKRGTSVATLSYDYSSGFLVPEHAHGSDQLIYATGGVMEVHSGESMWLIPPQFALWIPALTVHRIRMPSAVSMRTLYFRRGLVSRSESRPVPGLEPACAVLSVTSLLRELVLEAVRIGQLRERNREHCALRDLIVAQLSRAKSAAIQVRVPRDARALAVAQRILNDPAEGRPLPALCSGAGVSVRTLERLFRSDVGIGFDSWRRQVRLIKAVEYLVAGDSVKQVAFAVGYSQPSAFVEAFRRTFGVTPKVWKDSLSNA